MRAEEMTPAELKKIDAEIGKLIAESSKINSESRWYPFVVVTGLFAAIGTIMAVVHKLFY